MSYQLRDRPDGQVEIVMMTPAMIGVFPRRDVGQLVCDLLNDAAEDDPSPRSTKKAQTALAVVAPSPTTRALTPRQEPQAPVHIRPDAAKLTEAQREAAFNRLTAGETLAAVALEFGLTMGQLRGMWAQHKRQMQKFYSSGGQDSCKLCGRAFTPSASNPDTCARCSHEG